MHLLQQKYLKTHDAKQRKLWFLWVNDKPEVSTPQPSCSKHITSHPNLATAKCGCVGGCNFFGNNRNGVHFFRFSRQDVIEGLNMAQFRVSGPGEDLGYGQSLLNTKELVFPKDVYSALTVPHYDHPESQQPDHLGHYKYNLSAGYTKSLSRHSPMLDKFSRHSLRQSAPQYTRHQSLPQGSQSQHQFRSLGRSGGLAVPSAREISPGSLSDLRLSVDNVSGRKMPSSLSLQAELPLHALASGTTIIDNNRHNRASRNSLAESPGSLAESHYSAGGTSHDSFHTMVQRTISLGSEALSEAFYSADEDQVSGSWYIHS